MRDEKRVVPDERRRYIRLDIPLKVEYRPAKSRKINSAVTKNMSADGLRFETASKDIKKSDAIELKIDIPEASNPIHARGVVIWKSKISLEDASPFDMGIEFETIEEDNKNTFLKFFCDRIYDIGDQAGAQGKPVRPRAKK